MFGWLKQWGSAARKEREDREVEDAMARTVAMARAMEERRAREKVAQDEAKRLRDAAWERSRQQARALDAHRSGVVRDMAEQRVAPAQSKPPTAPASRESASSFDDSTPAYLFPTHHTQAVSDWCGNSSGDSSFDGGSGGSDGGGGSCGGGE